MRLTCPNCGAQYQVPDEVIPPEGRDVQCSNCGNTWFQASPDAPDILPEAEDAMTPGQPAAADFARAPGPAPEAEPEEPDATDGTEPDGAGQDAPDQEELDQEEPAVTPPEPVRQELDNAISDILRQEAEREAQLRAVETTGLESQPELGLDAHQPAETAERARQARDRMARLRHDEPEEEPAEAKSAMRRELLPDIEEINSTLRSSDMPAGAEESELPSGPAAPVRRSGFLRGFSVALLIGAFLVLSYANAPRIARSLPQVDPALSAYVATVDQARYWLDARLGDFVTRAFPE